MSYITEVVLHVDYSPKEVTEHLTEPFDHRGSIAESLDLIEIDGGGTKTFCGDIYAGAFNYLSRDALLSWLKDLVKDTLTSAVLTLFDESGDVSVYLIEEGSVKKMIGVNP